MATEKKRKDSNIVKHVVSFNFFITSVVAMSWLSEILLARNIIGVDLDRFTVKIACFAAWAVITFVVNFLLYRKK